MLKMKAQERLPARRQQLLRQSSRTPPKRSNLRKWDPNSFSKQSHFHSFGWKTMPPTSWPSNIHNWENVQAA